MNETLEYLQLFARFPFALQRFLRHTVSLDEARRAIRERMANRDERFLRLVRSVYSHPRSLYLPLLKHAGCELGDLRNLVTQDGLESALRSLRERGVFVTFEELRGRKPIGRNGLTMNVTARDFDNSWSGATSRSPPAVRAAWRWASTRTWICWPTKRRSGG